MKRISTRARAFPAHLAALERRGEADFAGVDADVRRILDDVRRRGDRALVEMAARFDGVRLGAAGLRVSPAAFRKARRAAGKEVLALLEEAADRIRRFHREQLRRSWHVTEGDGTLLGQNISAVASAGLYVPGGKAAYPSTVLMNAIPAQVAGVGRLAVCTPASGGEVAPLVLAACDLLGIGEVYRTGGAQAIAALAYGTKTIPRVDKIVGPGNIWVATAKKQVYGTVSIDSVAGPSEIFIVADRTADPVCVAADLLSQAEHDQMATCVLLTDDPGLPARVELEVARQLKDLPRRAIAGAALEARGSLILTRSLEEAFDLVDRLGPEHLEVLTADPLRWLTRVRYAGSAFLGPWTPEPMGDYLAGPNHVLPTGGAARFSSSLGVDDFLVRSNVLCFTREGFNRLAGKVERFAALEGLTAHARSVEVRRRSRSVKRR